MDHFDGICRYLKEAERESDSHGGALCGVLAYRERGEHHGIHSGKSEAVPDYLIVGVAAEFLFHDDHSDDKSKPAEHLLAAGVPDVIECLNAYRKHGKAYEEGIAVGQIVGKVEAVKSEVCPVVRHKQNQNAKQTAEADAGSQPDSAAGEEDRNQQNGEHRAVDIRQIVPAFRGRVAVKRAGENIPEVEIARNVACEFILGSRGFAKRKGGRNEYPHREHTADSRGPDEADEILDVCGCLVLGRKSGIA